MFGLPRNTHADIAGRAYVMKLVEGAGLKPRIDAAGNTTIKSCIVQWVFARGTGPFQETHRRAYARTQAAGGI